MQQLTQICQVQEN